MDKPGSATCDHRPCGAGRTFEEHYAAARARSDLITWCFLILAAALLGAAQTFQGLHAHHPMQPCGPTAPPLAAASTGPLLPPTCPATTSTATPPPTAPPGLPSVTCGAGSPAPVHSLLGIACFSSSATLAVFLVAVVACLAACQLAPTWTRRGGRSFLLGVARVAPRLIGLGELLLLPLLPPAPGRTCPPVPASGTCGAIRLLFTALFFPVPLKAQLLISTLEAALLLAHNALAPPDPPPAPALLLSALRAATLGVLAPCVILASYEHRLRLKYDAAAVQPPQQHPPQQLGHPQPAAPAATAEAAVPGPLPSPRPPLRLPPKYLARPLTPPVEGSPPAARRTRYVSRLRACTVSIKVRHQDAFDNRERLTTAVEACLANLCTQPTAPPPPCPSPSAPPAIPPPGPAPRAGPHLLSSVTIQGCLQILTNIYQPHDAPGPPLDPSALAPPILSALPAPFAHAPVTVTTTAHHPTAPGAAAVAAVHPTPTSPPPHPHGLTPLLQLHPPCIEAGSAAPQVVLLAPTGDVIRTLQRTGGLPEGNQVEAVVRCWRRGRPLVVREPLGLPLDGPGTDGGSPAPRSFRIDLPPGLDAAPVELHLLAACPGHEGTLLAAATTMALPAAAAQELLAALHPPSTHPHHPEAHGTHLPAAGGPPAALQPPPPAMPAPLGDPHTAVIQQQPGHAPSVAALLSDWAVLWLSRAPGSPGGLPDATEMAVLSGIDHWLAAHGCPACRDLLALLSWQPEQQQQQQAPVQAPCSAPDSTGAAPHERCRSLSPNRTAQATCCPTAGCNCPATALPRHHAACARASGSSAWTGRTPCGSLRRALQVSGLLTVP